MRVALIATLLWGVLIIASGERGSGTVLLVTLGIPWGIYFIVQATKK